MHVAVGSTNPVKRRAVEHVVDARVTVVDVDSGVPEQPRGNAETVEGAERRAERALDAAGASVGVGIEGGVTEFDGTDGLFVVAWSAATDGDRWGRAASPSLRLPEPVARRIRAGGELGPVLDDLLEREGVKHEEGAAGVLTGGRVGRTDALATGVAGAVAPVLGEIDRAVGTASD